MRVTNNMILRNSSYNINGTKGIVNNSMNQMTTQKKINKPSDDPVVAIRSLRLSTSLSRVEQYYKKNIPDAESWLDVTETALTNIKTLMTDIRTQCVNGATDTLTQDDRNTILAQLKALQSQVYAEGNADYAGRTVFTGFRTDQDLIYTEDEKNTEYTINQSFTYEDAENFRYYTGDVKLPSTRTEVLNNPISDTRETDYYRLVTAYANVGELNELSYSYPTATGSRSVTYTRMADGAYSQQIRDYAPDGQSYTTSIDARKLVAYETEEEWAAATGLKEVADGEMVFIKETGQLILGNDVASEIRTNHASIDMNYDKKGFSKGELKPEYYFNCTDKTNPTHPVTYEKFDAEGNEIGYDINYTVSVNQELTVNLEASDAFNSDIQRDVDDLISAVDRSIKAHDKIAGIKKMMGEAQYSGEEYQAKLKEWLTAAQKEADYADDHMQKLYSKEIGKVDEYLGNVNLAISKVGCTVDQLKLTETRMSNQQETIMELQSENDDLDVSEIIINYTAAYNAYQSSLTAAGKLSGMTLLNYI